MLRDSPYMAKTDKDGRFEIKNIPVGSHTFRFWHERVGYLKEISIGKHKTTDRGKLTIQIDKRKTQLGTATVPMKVFEPKGEKAK